MKTQTTLDLGDAKSAAQAAEQEARRNNWPVVIAIVDRGGHLVYLQRDDAAQLASVEVAIAKARSALVFRRPTHTWEERLAEGRLGYLAMPGVVPVEGGLPVTFAGEVVGAVGVSGVKSIEDAQVARAAVAAIERAG